MRVALAMLVVCAVACTRRSDLYCQQHVDDPRCGIDAMPGCSTNDQCVAPRAVCDPALRTCVQCLRDQAAACTGGAPICSEDNSCRACQSHDECATGACLPDGQCASPDDVSFVEPSGTGEDCLRAAPCDKVSKGVAKGRRYVLVRGTVEDNVTINGRQVTLLGAPGARLWATSGNVIHILGPSTVEIRDLRIGHTSRISTTGIVVDMASSANVLIERARIENHIFGGIQAQGGQLALHRSVISSNAAGGVRVSSNVTAFTIRNNVVQFNGESFPPTPSSFGGIEVSLPGVAGRVELNTIVLNRADGAQNAAGLACYSSGTSARGNLLWSNMIAAGPQATFSGNCATDGSYFGTDDPRFVNPTGADADFHLTAASPATIVDAIELSDCAAMSDIDLDGDERPVGPRCDVGADEHVAP